MSEQQELKEYRQGDTVRLTVELRDEHGGLHIEAWAKLDREPEDGEWDIDLNLSGRPDEEETQAQVVISGTINQQVPGVYKCSVFAAGNAYNALTSHKIDPPLRFRIVEHPDDIRRGPEVLSVGAFW